MVGHVLKKHDTKEIKMYYTRVTTQKSQKFKKNLIQTKYISFGDICIIDYTPNHGKHFEDVEIYGFTVLLFSELKLLVQRKA